ncbi:5-(carboxyamino)imidazole ribonucleotide synthase [Rhizobiales bacterium GAS188]|nr:5-(carboxyamino)imidazole ribonucleotide synthase [Rhizobiales bacterium GAS188]
MTSRELAGPLEPGATIGILGGGQLGRMIALAAADFGLRIVVYEPEISGPAAQVTNQHMAGAYGDEARLAAFAARVDVVTYEFENVPAETVAYLARLKPVRPGGRLLAVAQDRFLEKSFFAERGIATAPFARVDSVADLESAVARIGPRCVLKTRRFGYDGKGQVRIEAGTDLVAAWLAIGEAPAILEGFVPFQREVSVVAARSADASFAAFDLAENEHRDHILARTAIPAKVAPATAAAAIEIARRTAEALEVVGVFAVEMFVCETGGRETLLVNEIAPRVHNTGHWTIEGAETSQFAQHVRAICGWPLGSTRRLAPRVEMENLIGAGVQDWARLIAEDGAHLHLYGKDVAAPGRKMGHVTRLLAGPRQTVAPRLPPARRSSRMER